MKSNPIILVTVAFIAMLFFTSSCAPPTTISTADPPSKLLPTSTALPAVEPTPTEWLPYNPNFINNGECEELAYTAMPVKGTEDLTNEKLAQNLFVLYLEKHISLPPHHYCKLQNYRIEQTTSDPRIDQLAMEQGVDFVNWIRYSVQINEVPSSWVAGNGDLAPNGWIVHKALIIGVIKIKDEYVLKLIGTGP